MLAARERGLGTCWTTLHLMHEEQAAQILGIPYDRYVQVALIPIAHSIGTEFRPGARKPLSDVLHWDTWTDARQSEPTPTRAGPAPSARASAAAQARPPPGIRVTPPWGADRMEAEAPETFDLGDLSGLADGSMRCFEDAGEFRVVLCRVRGILYALEDNCSHADAPLDEGRLRGHTVTCAQHVRHDAEDGPNFIVGGRYEDQLVCTEHGWRDQAQGPDRDLERRQPGASPGQDRRAAAGRAEAHCPLGCQSPAAQYY